MRFGSILRAVILIIAIAADLAVLDWACERHQSKRGESSGLFP